MMLRLRHVALVWTLALGAIAPALASAQAAQPQPQGEDLDQAARALFLSGREAFARGEFEVALTRFRSAYDASPQRHILLYNIATTLDRLRRDDEALAAFERYLELDPSSNNRGEIEGRIRALRSVVDANRARLAREQAEREERERLAQAAQNQQNNQQNQQPDPQRPVDTQPQDSAGLDPLFVYIAGGVTVAMLGLTIWSGLNTNSLNDDYTTMAVPGAISVGDAERLYNDAHGAQTRTNVFLGITAVAAIGTGVLVLLADWDGSGSTEQAPPANDAARDEARVRARPIVSAGPEGAMIGLSGSF